MLKRLLPLTLVLCLLVCSSCQAKPDTNQPPNESTVTFTDALHRTVTIEKNPSRVAALIGSFADVWMLAGGTVCATADDAWDDFELALPEDTVNLGNTKDPSLEALLASEPDLVLASAATSKNVEWKTVLEQAQIPVAYFDVSSFSDYLQMLEICTAITGRRDLYEQNGLALQTQIDTLRTEFQSTGPIPSVLFLRASAGYIRAKNSQGSVLGEMLADLGCVNIADRDKTLLENLSLESILQQNPDYILIVQVGDDADAVRQSVNNLMKENPAWQELSAVREGRLLYLDKRLFNLKPNARWAEAYETLTNLLSPTT